MKWVVGQSMFDVGQDQFLMLLLVLDADFYDGGQLFPIPAAGLLDKRTGAGVEVVAVVKNLLHGRTSDQAPLRSRIAFTDLHIVGIEQVGVLGLGRLVIWPGGGQHKSFEEPTGVGQMPLGGAGVRHALNYEILGGERFTNPDGTRPNVSVALQQ